MRPFLRHSAESMGSMRPGPSAGRLRPRDEDVQVELRSARLSGRLTVPTSATGIVVFVHGSGSSRTSPRNRYVARVLNEAGLATLLFDLLTPDEAATRTNVFDISLLAGRLNESNTWLRGMQDAEQLAIGYFGASTGAAAALWTAADRDDVGAIVSRGGRPDLAEARLADVRAPTLLIVGARDDAVLALNREAQAHLRCPNELVIVPGATHLFEEPGALEAVAAEAQRWFSKWLSGDRPGT
jgi:putative phosphoribosyl transferase